jgi:cytochrome c-type biogenesis protein CcmH
METSQVFSGVLYRRPVRLILKVQYKSMKRTLYISPVRWYLPLLPLAALLLAAIFSALAFVVPALAQDAPPTPQPAGWPTDDEVNAIAKQMYCPVCENTPLDVCPTQACAEWRGLIRDKLAEGWTEQQIKDYFVEQFGDRVLAAPPARGLNWLVYIIPPVAILAGAFLLYRAFRTWRQPVAETAASSGPATSSGTMNETASGETTDEYVQRLEEELRKL